MKLACPSRRRHGRVWVCPADELWHISPETKSFFEQRKAELKKDYNAWTTTYNAWKSANPALAKELEDAKTAKWPKAAEVLSAIPEYDASKNVATASLVLMFCSTSQSLFLK